MSQHKKTVLFRTTSTQQVSRADNSNYKKQINVPVLLFFTANLRGQNVYIDSQANSPLNCFKLKYICFVPAQVYAGKENKQKTCCENCVYLVNYSIRPKLMYILQNIVCILMLKTNFCHVKTRHKTLFIVRKQTEVVVIG